MDEIVGLMVRSETPVQPSPVVSAYDNMLQVMQAVHRSELQELKTQHQKELQHLEERHRSEIQQLNVQHQQGMEALERKHIDSMTRMERHHEKSGAAKDRWINRQFWLRIIMTGIIIVVVVWALILDSKIGNFGIFRY